MKKTRDFEKIAELIVVIMLGVTALLTAWASWIGSLHGGNQSTNYTVSNNLAAEGNSEYNAAVQQMNQDMLLWNDVADMQMEILLAQENEDQLTVDKPAISFSTSLMKTSVRRWQTQSDGIMN